MNSTTAPATSNYRWIICALLFFSTTVNYMDRQVISYLKEFFCTPTEQGGFGWSNTDFAYLTSFFTGIYAGFTVAVSYTHLDVYKRQPGGWLPLHADLFAICDGRDS